jgi:stage IV sporulation protein FB
LIVAVAGPAVNVAIAAILIAVLGIGLDTSSFADLDNPQIGLLARLAVANVILVVFNLIPAFPMDGGRVLRALLAMRMDHVAATRIAARIGQGTAFVFALLGLFVNPMLIVIGLFVYLAATAEAQHVALRDGTQGLPVKSFMMSSVEVLGPNSTLDDAVDLLLRTSQREFPVVDGSGRARGLLTRDGLIVALSQGDRATPVVDAMVRDLPTVLDWQPFDIAVTRLTEARAPALLVLNDEQQFVGLLTPETIGEMMMVRSARPDWRFRSGRTLAGAAKD